MADRVYVMGSCFHPLHKMQKFIQQETGWVPTGNIEEAEWIGIYWCYRAQSITKRMKAYLKKNIHRVYVFNEDMKSLPELPLFLRYCLY